MVYVDMLNIHTSHVSSINSAAVSSLPNVADILMRQVLSLDLEYSC